MELLRNNDELSIDDIKLYINARGEIYSGDLQEGDREATPAELEAHFGSALENLRKQKLRQFYIDNENYRQTATVEFAGKNFSISQDAKINLMAVVSQSSLFKNPITYFEKNGNCAVYNLEEFLPIAEVISRGIVEAENYYYSKEKEINDAQSIADLEAITWLNGL